MAIRYSFALQLMRWSQGQIALRGNVLELAAPAAEGWSRFRLSTEVARCERTSADAADVVIVTTDIVAANVLNAVAINAVGTLDALHAIGTAAAK